MTKVMSKSVTLNHFMKEPQILVQQRKLRELSENKVKIDV